MTTATPTGQTVAYVRVSTAHQALDQQYDALAPLSPVKVFEDKVTGRTMARPGWEQCRDYLRPGDTLAVVGLDRLGRSALEVIETVNDLAAAGIVVQSQREGILDPSSATGSLMISMFAALAQFEVDLKAERAAAAREAARLRGRQTGRPKAHTADVAASAIAMRESGSTVAQVCEKFGIPRSTFYRYAKAKEG